MMDQPSENDSGTKLCHQIDFYFSDFNLNTDKYLRNLLETSKGMIPMNELLQFKYLSILVSNVNEQELPGLFQRFKFENAQFSLDQLSFSRRNEFIYQRNFLKKMNEQVVHVRKLPQKITIMDLIDWATTKYGTCGIKPIKRDSEKNVRSAFIAFCGTEAVAKLLAQRDDEGKVDFDDRGKLHVITYQDYLKFKNKSRRIKKKQKILNALANLSISNNPQPETENENQTKKTEIGEQENKGTKKKVVRLGMRHLAAKRTVWLHNVVDPMIDSASLKQILANFGLLYLYAVRRPRRQQQRTTTEPEPEPSTAERSFFLFFKNRTVMNEFYQTILKGSKMDFSTTSASLNNNIPVEKLNQIFVAKNISLMTELSDVPKEYNHYVKRLKTFFKKKNKL